jgi:hypothetical protein
MTSRYPPPKPPRMKQPNLLKRLKLAKTSKEEVAVDIAQSPDQREIFSRLSKWSLQARDALASLTRNANAFTARAPKVPAALIANSQFDDYCRVQDIADYALISSSGRVLCGRLNLTRNSREPVRRSF